MKSELSKRILSSIVLFIIVFLIIIGGSFIFNLFLVVCLCITLFEWHKLSKKKIFYYPGIIFLIFSFYAVFELYTFNNNYLNFLLIFFICISTDIGGYIFGKIFKGPKLISISPKKTYAGAIGGLLLSTLSIIVFFEISYFFPQKPQITFYTYQMIILISAVSQFGDILISYFKRLSNTKDTGNLIPGHGGLLDRADGMIFAFPFYYIILISNSYKFF